MLHKRTGEGGWLATFPPRISPWAYDRVLPDGIIIIPLSITLWCVHETHDCIFKFWWYSLFHCHSNITTYCVCTPAQLGSALAIHGLQIHYSNYNNIMWPAIYKKRDHLQTIDDSMVTYYTVTAVVTMKLVVRGMPKAKAMRLCSHL